MSQEPEAVYRYTNAVGALLFEVIRGRGKRFTQRRQVEDGGYVYNLNGVERPLYRLPDVYAHLEQGLRAPIYVVEGEKDADAIAATGATATCNPGGAGKWRDEHTDALVGARHIIVIADKDETGERHARSVAAALRPIVDELELVQASVGKDAADHLEAGLTLEELVPLEDEEPAAETPSIVPLDEFLVMALPKADPLLGSDDDVVLAHRGLSIVYGDAGDGKTTWLIDLLAHLASGTPWLGIEVGEPVRVCLLVVEGPPELLREKLERKARTWTGGSWRERLFVYVSPWARFRFDHDLMRDHLRAFIEQNEIALVAGDPLDALGIEGLTPSETLRFVADVLPLAGIGSGTSAHGLFTHHVNKAGQISGAWKQRADTVIRLEASARGLPESKMTWEKVRWGRYGSRPKTQRLLWIPECEGFELGGELGRPGVADETIQEEILNFVAEHPRATMTAVLDGVEGDDKRVRGHVQRLLDERRLANETGSARGFKLVIPPPEPTGFGDGLSPDHTGELEWR